MKYLFFFFIVGLAGFAIWKIFTSAALDRFLSNLSKGTNAKTIQEEFDHAKKHAKCYHSHLEKTEAEIAAEKRRVGNIKK